MALNTLIVFFCLGFTFSRGNAEEDMTDFKALLQKALLEIRELKQEVREIGELKQEVREIAPLKRKIRSLEEENSLLRHEFGNLANEVKTLRDAVERHQNDNSGVNSSKLEARNSSPRIRLLSPEAVIPTPNAVAFFAYRSSDEHNPSAHHTLIFDVIKVNVGNGYNGYSGIFSPPEGGLYAISYGITCGLDGSLYFHFMKNGDIIIDKRCDNDEDSNDYKELSGTIIVQLNSNDIVYISTKKACTTDVKSYEDSRSFFSGWKIN